MVSNRLYSGARHSARGLAVCLSFMLAACSGTAIKEEALTTDSDAGDPAPQAHLQIAAVGDIMLGSDFPEDRLPPGHASILAPVAATLQQADLTIGNLEGVLQDGGEPVKSCKASGSCYLFRTPVAYVAHLKESGFDVLGLANNHARDFGESGRDSSMAALASAGIAHTGREGDFASLEVRGRKVAVVAFAPYQGSNNMLAHDTAAKMIRELAMTHQLVIVSFHGGAEGGDRTRIPFAREYFHGEDRGDVVAFARMAVDAGADLVVGHGPHVPRALELYRERLIAYSLGNFATYWGIKISGPNGLAPILKVELDRDGRFVSGRIISAKQHRPAGTLPDEAHTAARLMRELTLADFPDTPLVIDSRGNIRRAIPSVVSGAPPPEGEAGPSVAQAATR